MSSDSSSSQPSASPALRVQIASFNANLQGIPIHHRQDHQHPSLTTWLVPTVDQQPSSSYASTNPNTPSSHPGLPREAPDIYAVGFQELVPLSVGLSATSSSTLDRVDVEIRRSIRHHQAIVRPDATYPPISQAGGPESYALLAKVDLVSIALFVYARESQGFPPHPDNTSVASRVKEIRTAKVGTGLAGLMGNKGAVGVRLVIADRALGDDQEQHQILTFVSAHLTAHDHNVERRNWDYQQIVKRLVFEPSSLTRLPPIQVGTKASFPSSSSAPDPDELKQRYQSASSSSSSSRYEDIQPKALDNQEHTIYDTDHLFLFGDLNHRISLSSPHLTKRSLEETLSRRDWASLQPFDQLSAQRLSDPPRSFHGLTELSIQEMNIPPTYKYKPVRERREKGKKGESGEGGGEKKDTPLLNQLSSKRVPGWTDRILWASSSSSSSEVANKGGQESVAYHKQGVEVELFRSIMEFV
ncbi:DNase I-like protein, partial [Violaceomyces palustris]